MNRCVKAYIYLKHFRKPAFINLFQLPESLNPCVFTHWNKILIQERIITMNINATLGLRQETVFIQV